MRQTFCEMVNGHPGSEGHKVITTKKKRRGLYDISISLQSLEPALHLLFLSVI